MQNPRCFDLSVYFIADPSVCAGRRVVDVVAAAVKGGASMVQLRDKTGVFEDVKEIKGFLLSFPPTRSPSDFFPPPIGGRVTEGGVRIVGGRIPFIINDDVMLAKEINADGVHLGQGDMSALEARKILGPDKIIGVTAFEDEHFAAIDPAVVDYAGTGPFYATKTKPGKKILGALEFTRLVKLSPVPVVGIGGITPDNAGAVMACGAAGVAMMRGVSEANDPEAAARAFVEKVRNKK